MGKIRSKGAKLKFSIGEKVLCYEPDPRKPKLLFESKILNIFSNKVERGRKVYEYLIHFLGFNKRYDHCVREEFILPFTEENQTLQKKLDEEARLKYKKDCKDSSSINENLAMKMHTKKDSGKTKQKSAPHSSSADTESEDEFEIEMDLSDVLRGILEQDFLLIKNQKLIRLPCEMNVISILEDYIKYVAARCVLAPKDIHKNIDMESVAAEFEFEMKLCIEAMHGIRIYFDHTLRHLLLYPEEKQQFYTFGHTCAPIFDPSRYEALSLEDALLEFERVLEDDNESNEPEFIDSEAAFNNSQVQFETENEEISDAEIIAKIFGDSDDDEEFEGFSIEDIESGQTEDCAKSKKEDQDLARKIISKTIRSMQDTGKLKPPTAEDSSSSITTTKRTIINFDCPSDPCCSTQAAQELEYPKSTITTRRASFISNLAIEVEKYNRKVLNEMAYRMVPPDLYNVPAAPSLIYGAHHLLRLFVKLPALMSKQGIEEGKLRILLEILVDFLSFLIRKRKSFFKRSDYMSDTEAFPITID